MSSHLNLDDDEELGYGKIKEQDIEYLQTLKKNCLCSILSYIAVSSTSLSSKIS